MHIFLLSVLNLQFEIVKSLLLKAAWFISDHKKRDIWTVCFAYWLLAFIGSRLAGNPVYSFKHFPRLLLRLLPLLLLQSFFFIIHPLKSSTSSYSLPVCRQKWCLGLLGIILLGWSLLYGKAETIGAEKQESKLVLSSAVNNTSFPLQPLASRDIPP